MSETIQGVKARIDAIDKQVNALQCERFSATLRLSALLAQAAKANPPAESAKQLSVWADDKCAPGVTGFEKEFS